MLTVNKLDRCFLELMLDGEEAYNGFCRVIESANVIMATYADDLLGDTQVCGSLNLNTQPLCGTSVFVGHACMSSPPSRTLL